MQDNKIDLLKKYISIQAEDADLWFRAKYVSEEYLQQELRRVAWMIEEASNEQIEREIISLKERL